MFETTIIRKIKRGRWLAREPAYVIDEDAHGLWLYSPKGSLHRGQSGTEIIECEVGQGKRPAGLAVMHLITPMTWWIAHWADAPSGGISVDVCTPPVQRDGEWAFVDLELDPYRHADGEVGVEDEDEFLDACRMGLISNEEAREARAATRKALEALRIRTEPFGDMGWHRLVEAKSLSLPPLRELPRINTSRPLAGC